MINRRGFTIVELLIVIVVVAILAAISIVAYNGIQSRATFAKLESDVSRINKSLALYYAEHGSYPVTGTISAPNWRYSCTAGIANFIPELEQYGSLPQAPCKGANASSDTWLYASDGVGYKLVQVRPAFSDEVRNLVPESMRDPVSWDLHSRWGYWTTDWKNL